MTGLIVGVAAALTFPVAVLLIYSHREKAHNRRAGRRRTQKIRLVP